MLSELQGMPAWLQMELLNSILIHTYNKDFKKATYGNDPIIKHSLKVWSQLLSLLKALKLHLNTPLCYNHAFIGGSSLGNLEGERHDLLKRSVW